MAIESGDKSEDADRRTKRKSMIQAAAIAEFSARGVSATSMANIAATAGMSRPALYQYFSDKADIFASAFVALFEDQAYQALAELEKPGSPATQLDGFLQRYNGDLWQRISASPHSDELLNAKDGAIAHAIDAVVADLGDGLGKYLRANSGGTKKADQARRTGWEETLRMAPLGFKTDQPEISVYRRRLAALAQAIAADMKLA